MVFNWFRNDRRQEWLSQPQPSLWEGWLRTNVWQYSYLTSSQQQRVRDFVCILFHEKNWEGGNGFEITDEMRVAIAGQAALLTLGFNQPYYFDRLLSIIVYAESYQHHPSSDEALILGRLSEPPLLPGIILGEAMKGGPVVLAWKVVRRDGQNARRHRSVVLHEFAHHIDSLDGTTDGNPPMNSFDFEKKWYEVTDREYRQLLHFAQHNEPSLLDHYGATNHAEFFAVSTECFFTTPHKLAQQHSELYDVLVRFFGQDPRQWLPIQDGCGETA